MKVLIIISFVLLIPTLIYGQNQNCVSCSNLLTELSAKWRQDSLANNNYRLKNYKRIVNCQIDSLSVTYLIEKLGKPNQIRETNHGFEYWYYIKDDKTIVKVNPFECLYLTFNFNQKKQFVEVVDGVLDY